MKYLTALFLCSITIGAMSQTDKPARSSISLSLGPAIPLGDFGSMNGTSAAAGLANLGGTVSIGYQHRIRDTRFGWSASLRGRLNSLSKSATEAPFAAEFPGYQWTMNSSHWTSASALIGGYYEWPITPKLSLQANLGIGVAECWSPNQTVTGVRDSAGFGHRDLVKATAHSVSATTFTALAGLGIRYHWRGRWSLLATADYSWLKPTFHNFNAQLLWAQNLIVPAVLSFANASSVSYFSTAHDYTQSMPTLDITIGVARAF